MIRVLQERIGLSETWPIGAMAKMVAGEFPERIALLNGDSERRAGAKRRGMRRSAGGMRQEQGRAGLEARGVD